MKELLKYEDDRYQKLNASYNTVKNTLTALLQNQEPAAAAPSTSDSAALNTLAALQAELNTEKLQRQLLVSGFMSQTAQHKAKVKQLEEELAKAKAELAAVGSLASTSKIQQAETHVHIQSPQLPEMPEFQSIEEEQQQRPAPGALDIREEIEQEIEDLQEGPAKEYLMYEKKVMQSVALAFLQPKEQVKDFGTDFLPLPLMRHEAILWKEKMRPAVQRNEDGDYEDKCPNGSAKGNGQSNGHTNGVNKNSSQKPFNINRPNGATLNLIKDAIPDNNEVEANYGEGYDPDYDNDDNPSSGSTLFYNWSCSGLDQDFRSVQVQVLDCDWLTVFCFGQVFGLVQIFVTGLVQVLETAVTCYWSTTGSGFLVLVSNWLVSGLGLQLVSLRSPTGSGFLVLVSNWFRTG
ncbi:hypothetical protein L7F22_032005 [Adiantum nelumboides]|nr:hypothetical protein [Adiantum nelumboides]